MNLNILLSLYYGILLPFVWGVGNNGFKYQDKYLFDAGKMDHGTLDPYLNVEYIVKAHNFTIETHSVVTTDGYILKLHRIPSQRRRYHQRPVVFLQHGMYNSSLCWVSQPPGLGLAYLLANAGFDVWMGNARGNLYSNRHTHYSLKDPRFWAFSWQHMADYDLDAMINHALAYSDGQTSLYYVGHSEGTLIMFSKLAADPHFAKKIRKFFALAPIGKVIHMSISPGALKATTLLQKLQQNFPATSICNLLDRPSESRESTLSWIISGLVCMLKNTSACKKYLQIFKNSRELTDGTRKILKMHYASTSLRNVVHYLLMKQNSRHARLDPNTCLNLVKDDFDIRRIKTHVILYWSKQDSIANSTDVENYFMRKLPYKNGYQLQGFGHLDFVDGTIFGQFYHNILRYIRDSLPQYS